MRDAAQFFKVLADRARLQMLWPLFNERELCVCDVMEVLRVTQSKASRHLIALKHAGLVTDRKDGLWSYYQLKHPSDALARQHLELLRATLARRPESAALLRALRTWLGSKSRSSPCSSKGACASRNKGRTAARPRQPRALGASR